MGRGQAQAGAIGPLKIKRKNRAKAPVQAGPTQQAGPSAQAEPAQQAAGPNRPSLQQTHDALFDRVQEFEADAEGRLQAQVQAGIEAALAEHKLEAARKAEVAAVADEKFAKCVAARVVQIQAEMKAGSDKYTGLTLPSSLPGSSLAEAALASRVLHDLATRDVRDSDAKVVAARLQRFEGSCALQPSSTAPSTWQTRAVGTPVLPTPAPARGTGETGLVTTESALSAKDVYITEAGEVQPGKRYVPLAGFLHLLVRMSTGPALVRQPLYADRAKLAVKMYAFCLAGMGAQGVLLCVLCPTLCELPRSWVNLLCGTSTPARTTGGFGNKLLEWSVLVTLFRLVSPGGVSLGERKLQTNEGLCDLGLAATAPGRAQARPIPQQGAQCSLQQPGTGGSGIRSASPSPSSTPPPSRQLQQAWWVTQLFASTLQLLRTLPLAPVALCSPVLAVPDLQDRNPSPEPPLLVDRVNRVSPNIERCRVRRRDWTQINGHSRLHRTVCRVRFIGVPYD